MPRTGRRMLRRPPWPAPTIRLRLTVVYGVMFLITGAVLLTIGYALVRHNLDARLDVRGELRKLGIPPPPGPPFFGRLRFTPGSPETKVAEAVRTQLRNDALHKLLVEYLIALAVMTIASVGAGWLLAGRALRPLRDITAAARRVSGQNLGERIGLSGPADELKQLADTFDGMLGRLDSAFASQRHFVANASHELRTPLAIMRTEVDVALADPDPTTAELRAMGEAIRETIDRCERLIEGLLTLARSEASGPGVETVDLAALAGDCITDLASRARAAGVEIVTDLRPAWARGTGALLERMVANLIDNGIRHNEPDGHLLVSTSTDDGWAWMVVANGGRPIADAEAQTLAEPFRRLDRGTEGFGLGLSIVRSVVEVSGGEMELAAPAAGGLEVRLALPALPPASAEPGARAASRSLR